MTIKAQAFFQGVNFTKYFSQVHRDLKLKISSS